MRAYLTGQGSLIASSAPQKHQWVKDGAPIDTPFVSVPGLLSAKCTSNEHANYLEITVNADAADPRLDRHAARLDELVIRHRGLSRWPYQRTPQATIRLATNIYYARVARGATEILRRASDVGCA